MRFTKLKLLFLSLAISLSSSACALTSPAVQFAIPARPVACDMDVEINGVVNDRGNVELTMETAISLKVYIEDLEECVVVRDGHIEKLENRLEALGGKR